MHKNVAVLPLYMYKHICITIKYLHWCQTGLISGTSLQILLHSSLIFAIFYRISILLTVIVYSRAGH